MLINNPRLKRGLGLAVGLALCGSLATVQAQILDGVVEVNVSERANFTALESSGEYDQFIVHYAAGSDEVRSAAGLYRHLDEVSRVTGETLTQVRSVAAGGEVLQLGRKIDAAAARGLMKVMLANPAVSYIEPDRRMTIRATPNDEFYGAQWHYYEATAGMNLPTAWDSVTGAGVRVAVLDTGSTNHSDLNGNSVGGYDFISSSSTARDGNGRDSNPRDEGDWYSSGECGSPGSSSSSWHGTHVAGTVAAVTNNGAGVAGVAYGAKVVPIRVLGKCGGTTSDIADAIVWASGGAVSGVPSNPYPAEVINLSLGGGGACGFTYQNAINAAVSNGSTVVIAAGNENQNASNASPANCANVVTVAASDRQGNRANYSNYGSVVDVTAPGGETATSSNGVASTLNSGTTTPSSETYAYYQGTSMAAPHVAGLVALMLEADSSLTPAQVESALKANTRPLAGSCSDGCGAGLVDAAATVAAVSGGGGGGSDTSLDNGETRANLSGAQGSFTFYTVDVPSGSSNLSVSIAGGSGDADLYLRFGSQPTTSSYDCRPYRNGNNETCTVATPQAGTYHIGIRGYSAYSGLSLSASFDEGGGGGGGQQSFFENTSNVTIRDRSTQYSNIQVDRTGNAPSDLLVSVDIRHTYRGDLEIDLEAPDGSRYRLKNRSGSDSADNVIASYSVNASGEVAQGRWRLRVYDAYNGDTGYINEWSLQF